LFPELHPSWLETESSLGPYTSEGEWKIKKSVS
jgi:hypothetical protein